MDRRWKFRRRRSRNDSLRQDRLEHLRVGDPDPTRAEGHRRCEFEWADQTSPMLMLHWRCTRELRHQGQHIAGTGEMVAAVHPRLLPRSSTDGSAAFSLTRTTKTTAFQLDAHHQDTSGGAVKAPKAILASATLAPITNGEHSGQDQGRRAGAG
jgi:hypothetical protein